MCWFHRQEQRNGWRGNRWLTSKKTALPVGWLGCQIYTETSRCEACQKQVYINTHNKVTNRWANGWMESWLRNVEMMDPWLVVWRQINMPSERRTELDDRMLTKVSTHRCTTKQKQTKKKAKTTTITLGFIQTSLNLKFYFQTSCLCGQQNYLPCSWTSHESGQITIWFLCFLNLWQVNKAGANANKELLSDFWGVKNKWKASGVHWTFLSTRLSNMTRWLLQRNHPFNLPKDKPGSVQILS